MSFDVLDFATGASYPTATTHIYLNGKAGAELAQLERDKSALVLEGKSTSAIDKKIKALKQEIKKSSLTVEMRGYPEHVRITLVQLSQKKSKEEGLSADEADRRSFFEMAAQAVVSVTSPDGEKDDKPMDGERLRELYKLVPLGGMDEFMEAVNRLTLESVNFENTVTDSF